MSNRILLWWLGLAIPGNVIKASDRFEVFMLLMFVLAVPRYIVGAYN
jgi:hypothetical protein